MSSTQLRRDGDEIQPWDSDHTALVHVLWEAKRKGIDVDKSDELASLIMRSKWMRAVRQHETETWRAIGARAAAIIEAQCFDIPRLSKSRSAILHKLVDQLRAAALEDDPSRPFSGERWFTDALKRLRKGSD